MKNIVVFTGAGVSAESGLGTFRDADISISVIQESDESHAQKSGCIVCGDFFSIYGNRKADLRGTLGDGYNWLRIIKCRTIYIVSFSRLKSPGTVLVETVVYCPNFMKNKRGCH